MARFKLPVGLKKQKGGYLATVYLDCGDGGFEAKGFAKTQAGAIMKAASLASSLESNPIFQAIAPPGTLASIKAARMLAKGLKAGSALKVLKKFSGKGAKRLAKKLKFW